MIQLNKNMEALSTNIKKTQSCAFEGYTDVRYEELNIEVPDLPILGK